MLKCLLKSKRAVGFVDTGVKILIAVVIGALLLGGIYTLAKDTVISSTKEKVETMFDYHGTTIEDVPAEAESTLFSFTIPQGTFYAEKGMTWGDWICSEYNTTNLSLICCDHIGRDDGDGAGIELYYIQNSKVVYVEAYDLIDPSTFYQFQINTPIDFS